MDAIGTINQSGNATKTYEKDEIISCDLPWQQDLARNFLASGMAMELKADEVKEKKKTSTKSKAKPKAKVSKKKTTKK